MSIDHNKWMGHALSQARQGEGMTRPNPPVGAVVVKNGRIVGEGYHRKAGGPHAEVYALEQAGKKARGSILYVTLEPCSTQGRTPACTDRILASGVRHVVWSSTDPNPRHAGRAASLLREQGVTVTEGIAKEEGDILLAPFTKWITNKTPYVTLKLAMTIDGKIADQRGQSKWITGPAAREWVQALRRRVDAVLVGAGTVIKDDPSLWPRPVRGRTPWRVIMDINARTSPRAKVYSDTHAGSTWIAVGKGVSEKRRAAFSRNRAQILEVPSGRLESTRAVLRHVARMGALHVLCEGGGEMAASLIRANLVDEYVFFIAPKILGGSKSTDAIAGTGWLLPNSPELTFAKPECIGNDILIKAFPVRT